MIREDILQQFPELFGTKSVNGREVNAEETIATLTRELRPAIGEALNARRVRSTVPSRCAANTAGRRGTKPSTIRSRAVPGHFARSFRA